MKSSSMAWMFPPQPLDVSWLLEITYTIITSIFKLHYVMMCNQLHICSPASRCMKFKPFLARPFWHSKPSVFSRSFIFLYVLNGSAVAYRQPLVPSSFSDVPLSGFLFFSVLVPDVFRKLVSMKLHSDHVL